LRYNDVTKRKANGVVYTPTLMADYLANEMVKTLSPNDLMSIRILDPAIGDGELVISLLNYIYDINPSADISVTGYEIDSLIIASTEERIRSKYPFVQLDMFNTDFVEMAVANRFTIGYFDYIIANPPYIRTQILGAEKAQQIAKSIGLSGRIDIYYAFIVLAEQLLSQDGVAGFITSNKFMTIKAGKVVREYLENRVYLKQITDFGDTKLFDAAVLPCIIVFSSKDRNGGKTHFTSIYQTNTISSKDCYESVFDAINTEGVISINDGRSFEIKQGELHTDKNGMPWQLANIESTNWLSMIESKTWKRFSDIGKVRVGIKTTADNVFIKDLWPDDDLTPELLMPLITHRNAGQIIPNENDLWKVLYPHTILDGKKTAVNLEMYPKSYGYLLQHRKQLEGREYVTKAKRKWYEIWVPQNPESWKNRKIVFRDIAEKPQFWLDDSGAIVNGDCYWIDVYDETTDDELMLALAVANSSFIEDYYDVKFNNKLYAGKRRYMTQYVEDFPLPNPSSDIAKNAISLVRMIISNNSSNYFETKQNLDDAVMSMFC